ncbi:MAG: hypothetical protein NC102_04555 [Clostridium sp.]|nr:hypothetical protein [Clostridium sp.]
MSIALISSEPFGYAFPFDNLPENLRIDINEILGIISSVEKLNLLNQNDYFQTVNEWRTLISNINPDKHPAHKIAKSILQQLKLIRDDAIVVFVDTVRLKYYELVLIKKAAFWIKDNKSLVQFARQIGYEHERIKQSGYKLRTFTDLGFDYTISGDNQKCRFCGRDVSEEITFNKKAHAISFFLGNYHLLGPGECDSCNEFFGKEIEPHLHRYYHPTMIQAGITGRSNNPQIKGENFKQELDRFEYYPNEKEQNEVKHLEGTHGMNITMTDNQPIIKARVYRTLCKYAISLLDDHELTSYKKTIRWIMLKNGGSHRIPTTFRYEKLPCVDTPSLTILTPIVKTYQKVQCIVIFRFVTNLWVYALPFAQNDRYEFVNEELKRLIDVLKPNIGDNFTAEDFGTERRTVTNTHFSLEFGPGTTIKKVDDMTPEERDEFYKVVGGHDRTTFIVDGRKDMN